MVRKRVLVAERIRQVPRQFGWIDRRVLQEGYIGRCEAPALALYLLLVMVADAQGLSFCADGTLARLLSMSLETLGRARANLLRVPDSSRTEPRCIRCWVWIRHCRRASRGCGR